MDRRTFIGSLAGGMLGASAAAQAQQGRKVPRIGYVSSNKRLVTSDAFEQALRERGYVFGQNVVVEERYADGQLDRVRTLVDEVLTVSAWARAGRGAFTRREGS